MRMGGRPTDEERQARFDKWCGDKKAEIRAKIAAALSSPAAGSGGSPQSASPEGDGSPRPTVVTLCGSTRFYDAFRKAEYEEGLVGRIVLTVGFSVHRSDAAHGETVGCTPEQKIKLDELHKRKIDLSDEILVLNVGGYVGSSTRGEIEYARKTGKLIRWLEPRGESPTPEGEGDRSPPCVECAGTGDKHPGVYPSCDRFCCRCKRCAGTGKEPRGESPKPATEGGSAK